MESARSTTTSVEGAYRLPGVPPGIYRVQYELAGFGTVIREDIDVSVGFTATVNVELKVASLQESVTVSGASPVVDVTSTKTATIFEAKQLESLPNARDFWSIMAQALAVQLQRIDVGGSSAGTQTGYSAYDTKSDQHRPMVEELRVDVPHGLDHRSPTDRARWTEVRLVMVARRIDAGSLAAPRKGVR